MARYCCENIMYLLVPLLVLIQIISCQNELMYVIDEELDSPSIVGNIYQNSISLQDTPLNELTFQIMDSVNDRNTDLFRVDTEGVLLTEAKIDRDDLCEKQEICAIELNIIIGPADHFQIIPVSIVIRDINDNIPKFPVETFLLEIPEDATPGILEELPMAEDADYGAFDIQRYAIINNGVFDVSEEVRADGTTKLELHLTGVLDREVRDNYMLTVNAYDGHGSASMGFMNINITITDANDHTPSFDHMVYNLDVMENTAVNSSLGTVHASDLDIHENGRVHYAFLPNTEDNFGRTFAINTMNGELILRQDLDYETRESYQLGVVASDDGVPPRFSEATVYIHVLDINDNAPRITVNTLQPTEYAQVTESAEVGTFVAHIAASDADSGSNGVVACQMIQHNTFELEEYFTQYKIITQLPLNRESRDIYEVTLVCRDDGLPHRSTTLDLEIRVTDVNDHAPQFEQKQFAIEVQENNIPNASIFTVTATDNDIEANGDLTYIITTGSDWFDVDPIKGEVSASAILDHEQQSIFDLRIIALDNGFPRLNDTVLINVIIIDINDEVPMFENSSYLMQVTEEEPPEMLIGFVHATDADSPPYNVVTYELAAEDSHKPFRIDNVTGAVFTTSVLDADLNSQHRVTVIASNPGFIGLVNIVTVTIDINDINDNPPIISYPNAENTIVFAPNSIEIGQPIYRIMASDSDQGLNSLLSYVIVTGNEQSFFTVDLFWHDICIGTSNGIHPHEFHLGDSRV